MTTYQERKEAARETAINWQLESFDDYYTMSWSELQEWADKFYSLGMRYGLLREFRENGIPC